MRRFPSILTVAVVALAVGYALPRSAQDQPDAVAVDPDHYSVEFENDVVRLLRIQYGPGETSVMHYHPANCAVFINDQQATFETPDGEVSETIPMSPGDVQCADAEMHLPTNTGDGDLEVILLEFKGRETLQD